jgi:L-ascorbate metabolism protein UlaG (beta-lactamase superfamily)
MTSSADEPKFLRRDVVLDPLVDGFPAWLHTVAPVPAAVNLAFVQIPRLESELDGRSAGSARADPDRADYVAALLNSIKRDRGEMLDFASAVVKGAAGVRENAGACDVATLRTRLPRALDGLVEIVDDGCGHPALSFLESSIYRSQAYDERRQHVQLFLDHGGRRAVAANEPRLPQADSVDLRLPFRHAGLAEIALSRIRPITAARLGDALELNMEQRRSLGGLLTDEPTFAPDRYAVANGRARYFGNGCVVLQTPRGTVVSDPFISSGDNAPGQYTLDDLPDYIDLAIITGGRPNRTVLETLLQLRGRIGRVVVPRAQHAGECEPSLALYLSQVGMSVVEVDDFDEVRFPGGKVVATSFVDSHADGPRQVRSTYCVRLADATVFLGCDSLTPDPSIYRDMREQIGRIDMAFIAIGSESEAAGLGGDALDGHASTSDPAGGDLVELARVIVSELKAEEIYLYATGGGPGLSAQCFPNRVEKRCLARQVEQINHWCSGQGIISGRLHGKRQWCW